MKKLDVRFDTEKVDEKFKYFTSRSNVSKSDIARSALNIGLDKLFTSEEKDRADLIEEFK